MVKKFAEIVLRYRLIFTGIIIAVTILFGYYMLKIEIKTDYDDQLPRGHPFMEVHKKYRDKLGGSHMVMVMLKVRDGDVFNIPTLKKIEYIQKYLDSLPGVNHYQVISLASPKVKQVIVTSGGGLLFTAIMPEAPKNKKEVEKLERAVHSNDNIFGPLISYDNKCALLTANFIEGKFNYDFVFEKVNKLVVKMADNNTEIYAAGEPMLTGWIFHYRTESVIILLLTIGVMFLLLFIYFRSLSGVTIPMISGSLSAVWGLGFCGVLGFSLDPLILVIPLLITARAISHSVQMNERFFELYDEYKDKKTACILCAESIFPPGLLGIITDVGGILVIAVAPIPLLQKIALFCSFWIFSIVFTVMVLNPILFYYFPIAKNIARIVRSEKQGFLLRKILSGFGNLSLGKNAYIVVIVLGIIAITSGIISFHLKIGDLHPGSPILWPDSNYNIAIKNINENFPGTDQLFFIVEGTVPGLVRLTETQQRIRDCQIFLEQSPFVGGTQSFSDFAPYVNKFIHAGDPKWEVIPEDPLMMGSVMNIVVSSSSTGDFDRMMSRDHKDANIVIWCKDHRGETIRQVLKRAREWIQVSKGYEKIKFRLASGYLGILGAVNEVVTKAQAQNLALILLIMMISCSFCYRSFIAALMLLAPLTLATFLTMVVMVMHGISLNINTIPVTSIGIGVGVDYGIYILSRICEEFQVSKDYKIAIPQSIRTTGKAVMFTATTLVGGVIFWYFFSSLRFQAEMGLLLALLMLINMILALILIPSMVYVFKPKFVEKELMLVKKKQK